ncbi:hypothetical protein [Nonomuraea sp. C10]|uniref:hypothetical protein n=1 Tax=Nonomuraea sp. C10 TaxID=2600577 RepID=UPI0011CE9363|nr:hypothetical protein [Nonomuraea sp. C10]TXK35678.1 hypothetical protein FR742_41540 [Nonomuraea sp. C10]
MTATARRPEAPEAPGRRSGRRGGSRLLNAAVGLVLLGAAIGLQSLDLSHNEYSAPLTYLGGKGENVDATRFVVRLNSVTAAKSIRHLSDTLKTDRLFLVVDVSAKSKLKPYKLGPAVLLTTDGKKFSATDRIDSSATASAKWVQPDIWAGGSYFFEVPASVLAGARLVVGLPPTALVEPYQPEAEIDLALDEAAARKLVGSAQDVYSTAEK